jgi:tripeptide aminopeptidase
MHFSDYHSTVRDRFLRYVRIDTQSDPASPNTPSTEKQKVLARMLAEELREMEAQEVDLDWHGYVYATIPATVEADLPTICFCSHVDTSPDCSGTGVKPLVHENYQGGDLTLPDDPSIVLRPEDHPDLAQQIGNDVITASGTTLLGADNKAGVAAIMDAAHYLLTHRDEVKHGPIRILFTPDEEIGRGVDRVDMSKLNADFGYTIDGERAGTMEDETFSADGASLIVHGVSAHPGFAKGKLVNALKVAGDILARLPHDLSPEGTEGKEGFIHPVQMQGSAEQAQIDFIIRDFDTARLADHAAILQRVVAEVLPHYPGAKAEWQVQEQYRNMKEILDQHPQVVAYAEEAIRRAGLDPVKRSIRGGTDGSRLSFMGLPCPNIFAGEHAFHSKYEWVSVQDMEKAMQTIVHLAEIWAEKEVRSS